MKISYERLNQIIEEEVVRFKRLNEDSSNDPQELLKTKLDKLNNDTKKLQDFYTKLQALS